MDRHGRDKRLALLATRQAGAFSFRQAIELGFPSSTIGDRLKRHRWVRALPGVYTVAGAERSRLQALWVAWLAVGPTATLTHETSVLIAGAEGLPAKPITLTVPHRWHHHLPGVFVHQIDDLQAWHRASWRGLPISRPARAVVELAATQPEAVIGQVVDDLLNARRVALPDVARVFAEVARPGKPGIVKIARVLDARTGGYVPPASVLERMLFDTLAAGGLPAPRRQVPLAGRGGLIGIVDAAYEDARIILEADGRRWHDRVAAAAQDRRRDAEAARVGWQTLRFVHELLAHDPAETCAIVRDTRAVRLDLFTRAAS